MNQGICEMNHQKSVIGILGAGAVGLSIAGKLASTARVFVACRSSHARAITDRGLQMSGSWGDQLVTGITCINGPEDISENPAFVLITSKGTDTAAICDQYQTILRTCPVVTLQNGIGNEEIISRYAPVTIGGTIITNFSVEGEGHVRVKSESGPVVVGSWYEDHTEVVNGFVSLLTSAGIPAIPSPDIKSAKWGKSLLNIAVNPLCALLGISVGATGDATLQPVITGLIHETFAVMDALGIRVAYPDADAYLEHLYTVQIPDFYHVFPSMYYDIRDGKQTEIDLLNGYVAREGSRLGIATPYNQCIADLIRARQKQMA